MAPVVTFIARIKVRALLIREVRRERNPDSVHGEVEQWGVALTCQHCTLTSSLYASRQDLR